MAKNIEFKAFVGEADIVSANCERLGAKLIRDHLQTDTYYLVPHGRLKLRESNKFGRCLIEYHRRDLPQARESEYTILDVDHNAEPYLKVLDRVLDHLVIVTKRRRTYLLGASLINVDIVEGLGQFVEVEVQIEKCESTSQAQREAERLRKALGVNPADMISFSYAELKKMCEQGVRFREKLQKDSVGTLYVLDGASCSGKSTIKRRLLDTPELNLAFIPRYCTRSPRPMEILDSDYIFVSQTQFDQLKANGDFMEFRDFLFGMSYGLPWRETIAALEQGEDALAIMNLGNIRHIRTVFPEAITILITAPTETLRDRLIKRGMNDEAQIEERIQNAKWVESYATYYHHVVSNDDNELDDAVNKIAILIGRKHQ
ncbi:MAG: CYTH domain-containing protein [Anaerolineae bacterium]|nr:CYTH domain-containing protein [Anaerolineae bacterium]